jgi:ArsR family transcriptional regulator, arsenate/arsenite/antimonite-responsive transcriptional repressor / arsenate reductase (thioredoxin)
VMASDLAAGWEASSGAHLTGREVIGPVQRAAVHRALGDPHRLCLVDELLLSDRTPSELGRSSGLPSNLLTFHLDVLEEAGVVARSVSAADGRRRYVHLRTEVLATLLPRQVVRAEEVLFVCTANSARSQLAAALWGRVTGTAARSAGREPATAVHPLARRVAEDRGLDLGAARPRGYEELMTEPPPDLVVSVCDRAKEAGLPRAASSLHWSVPDPVTGGRDAFEAVFDELTARVTVLAASRSDAA